jgi:hypothetical protein
VLAELVAALLGGLLATAELISRYRDDPARAVWSVPAAVYVGVNAVASATALYLVRAFGWTFGVAAPDRATVQVLAAGFGSAALLRSSLFNITVVDQVVGVGPAAILNVILSAADRAVDRRRARIRSEKTSEIMKGVSFADHADSLVMYCWAAMQNTSPVEIKAIEDKVSALRGAASDDIPDQVKSFVLGLALQAVVGDRVLAEAVRRVRAVAPGGGGDRGGGDRGGGDGGGAERAPEAAAVLETIRQRGPIAVRTLQESSSMTLAPFTELLQRLTQAGSVEVKGEPGREIVTLAER